MPKQIVFQDKDNELKCYLNDKGLVYMEIQPQNNENEPYNTGFITLEKSDVKELIKSLKEIEKQMD